MAVDCRSRRQWLEVLGCCPVPRGPAGAAAAVAAAAAEMAAVLARLAQQVCVRLLLGLNRAAAEVAPVAIAKAGMVDEAVEVRWSAQAVTSAAAARQLPIVSAMGTPMVQLSHPVRLRGAGSRIKK
jgi:hypothetical protein